MNQWKNIAAIVALSLTAALAGTGCMAQTADDTSSDPDVMMDDQRIDPVADPQSAEQTGEAGQAWHNHCPFPRFLPFFGFLPFAC